MLKRSFIFIATALAITCLLLFTLLREPLKNFIGKEKIARVKFAKDLIFNGQILYGDTIKALYEDSIQNLYRDTNYFLKTPMIKGVKKKVENFDLLMFDLPNVFAGKHSDAINTGYIDFYQDKIYLVSGTGVFFKFVEDPTGITPYLVRSNFNIFANYPQFNQESWFGIKDILILNDQIFVSFTEKKGAGYNISIVASPIKDSLEFKLLLRAENFIDPNQVEEFNAHQSGGRMTKYKSDSILVAIGEFRDRARAQDNTSINGKILSVNYKDGGYRLVSKGHRNPQGLDYCDEHDALISSEHGPSGGDEVNFNNNTNRLKNFGWPVASYGRHYAINSGYHKGDENRRLSEAPLHKSHADHGFEEPVKYFNMNPGLSEVKIVAHDSIGIQFLVSTLGWDRSTSPYKRSLLLFDLNKASKEINMIRHIKINERIRDVVINPDNDCLYFLGETTGAIGKIKMKNFFGSNDTKTKSIVHYF